MRPRQWLIPEDSNAIRIPARDAYEKQIYVKPGSAMFGYILIGNWGMVSVGQLTCRITDACTGVSLTSEPLTRRQAGPPAPQQYFPKLLVIGEPGTLDVEISSTFPTDQVAQVVLCGGEPA